MDHVDDLDQGILPLPRVEVVVYYFRALTRCVPVYYSCIIQTVPKLPYAINR